MWLNVAKLGGGGRKTKQAHTRYKQKLLVVICEHPRGGLDPRMWISVAKTGGDVARCG